MKTGSPRAALEAREVVADRHGEGQQFFEGLPGMLEFDRDPAGLEAHAGGQVGELLADHPDRGFHQELRLLEPFDSQPVKHLRDLALAPHLVVALLAFGQAAQVGDQTVAVGEPAAADVVGDTRRHDLLGAAAAHTQEELDCGTVDEGAGKGLEFPDDAVDFAVPGWFCGHGSPTMLVRTCAKCNSGKDR